MSSRVITNGRIAWVSQDTPFRRAKPHPTNRDGDYLVDDRIDPDSPDAPWRPVGSTLYDPELKLEFRTVRPGVLDPTQGWASANFWLKRWNASFERYFVPLVRKGWVDAAAVAGSATRKYRCRDESRCLEWIREEKKRVRNYRKARSPR